MDELFFIPCPNCGIEYDDMLEACPHCGEPRPSLSEEEAYYPENDAAYYDEEGDYPEEGYAEDEPYYEEDYYGEEEGYAYDDPLYDRYHDPAYEDAVYAEPVPAETSWWGGLSIFGRIAVFGFGVVILFACTGLYFGGIGVFAFYQGYQEETAQKNEEIEARYNRGLAHMETGAYERAIAEFEYVLSLEKNHTGAQFAKREAEVALSGQPTATVPSYPDAAMNLFKQAETQVSQREWAAALQALNQIRNLDAAYQPDRVSEMLYTSNYQQGLLQLNLIDVEAAVSSFEKALAERPGDPKVMDELDIAQQYLEAQLNLQSDQEEAVKGFTQLFEQNATYLDVGDKLAQAYELWGDDLALQGSWCKAEIQYAQALVLNPVETVRAKAKNSGTQCDGGSEETTTQSITSTVEATTPAEEEIVSASELTTATATTEPTDSSSEETTSVAVTEVVTETTEPVEPEPVEEVAPAESGGGTTPSGGTILFSAFNRDENEWQILAVPTNGGASRFVTRHGLQPTISRDGRFMLYRSTLGESLGLHQFDFHTGDTRRMTILAQDELPTFGADTGFFIFNAQEPATGRWQLFKGYSSGLSEPEIIADGRTPAWAVDGAVAFQATTPDGNNPGIYVAGYAGAPGERLTMHESDRSPSFSPDGSQIAYMSTQGGSWDIYIINRSGGDPRQITTYGGNDGLPVWSPDGSQIAYVSDEGGMWSINIINATGGTPTKVTGWSSTRREDWLMSRIAWSPNP